MTPNSELASLWHAFNLREGPFFQETLAGTADRGYPAELFVGRKAETERMLRTLAGGRSSRQTVAGDPGVGKTTLAQHVKQRAASTGYLSYPEPVSLGAADSTDRLLERLLTYVYDTLLSHDTGGKISNLEAMQNTRHLVRAVRSRAMGAELSVLGTGGGFSVDNQYHVPPVSAALAATPLLRELAALAREKLGAQGIIVHMNNLENVTPAGRDKAALILRDVRDLLLYPGYHFILVGTADALTAIIGAHAQVRSVFGITQPLEPLSLAEVNELLERRYKYLRLNSRKPPIAPVERAAVAEVYELFRGDLRGTLRALEQAAERLAGYGDPATAPMSAPDIRRILGPLYLAELGHAVPQSAARMLLAMKKFSERSFMQKELMKQLQLPQSTLSENLQALQRQGYVEASGREGRAIVYRLAGAARLILNVAETSSGKALRRQ